LNIIADVLGAVVGGLLFRGALRRGVSLFSKEAVFLAEEFRVAFKEVFIEAFKEALPGRRSKSARSAKSLGFGELRAPSISQSLVGLAERRLPRTLSAAERQRWGEEMRADVASLPRWKRFWTAFNIWRKGAPKIPLGAEGAARSAGD
jgi:hypothetical protein